MWFAEMLVEPDGGRARCIVGSVTLAARGPAARPVAHWLMVLPSMRRCGIGRLLMATLETACWDAGQRQVWLETHAAWSEAAALYRTLGYVESPVRPPTS